MRTPPLGSESHPAKTWSQFDGFVVIDKPQGMTSHDVVQAVRRHLGVHRVGHLGTLDPMATGVLPLALGKATRLVEFLKGGDKVYEGAIRLGFATDTYDCEGVAISDVILPKVTQEQLDGHARRMAGEQLQTPPPFSAKKFQGVRAYRLARQGKPAQLAACRVQIAALSFTLSAHASDEVEFTIRCSAGTYVRSVAHDLGRNLGFGAHLLRLRRTGSGEFTLQQSISLSDFHQAGYDELGARLIPLNQVLTEYPALRVDAETEKAIAQGKTFWYRNTERQSLADTAWYRVLSAEGLLIALARAVGRDGGASDATLWHAAVVLATRSDE